MSETAVTVPGGHEVPCPLVLHPPNPTEEYGLDYWLLTGDLRLEPGWSDDMNHRANPLIAEKYGRTKADCEMAQAFFYPADEAEGKAMIDTVMQWWAPQVRAAYAEHPEWFQADGD